MIGIYKITNTFNNKVYIGQSIHVEKRLIQHRSTLKNGSCHNSHLQRSYNLHSEYFTFEILEECLEEQLDEREIYWIKYFDSLNPEKGYNKDSGGNKGRYKSEESKVKMAEAHRGKHHSQETKEKISKSKGKPVLCVETGVIYPSLKAAAEAVGVTSTAIMRVCKGQRKTAGGYHWAYA